MLALCCAGPLEGCQSLWLLCCYCCCYCGLLQALPAAAFLVSDNPVEMLGVATQLVLTGPAAEQPIAKPTGEGAAAHI